MSYAIIRNTKYTMNNLNGIYRHNERKNTNYSNTDIKKDNGIKNYSLKKCNMPYSKAFKQIKEENNLQGWIKKNSNIACEYIITSDKEFFQNIGEKETRRFFKTAYDFVKSYKELGEKYILSAKVHNDESTPHLHLVFIPVVHKKDSKSGKVIDKISCTEFWKGKNSYKILQNNFYSYMTRAGFELERGLEGNKHIETQELKKLTNYEVIKYEEKANLEQEREIIDTEELKNEYKRIIRKFNTLANHYTRIKTYTDKTEERNRNIELEYYSMKAENNRLKKENKTLHNYIEKSIKWVSIVLNMPFERIRSLINNFVERNNRENDRNKSSR